MQMLRRYTHLRSEDLVDKIHAIKLSLKRLYNLQYCSQNNLSSLLQLVKLAPIVVENLSKETLLRRIVDCLLHGRAV